MTPVDAKKIKRSMGDADRVSYFATDPDAPGWVSNGHFAVYVGEKAARKFVGGWKPDLFALLRSLKANAEAGKEAALTDRYEHRDGDWTGVMVVFTAGGKLVHVDERFAPFLHGLKTLHSGVDDIDPVFGLDEDGDLVAVVMPCAPTTGMLQSMRDRKRPA